MRDDVYEVYAVRYATNPRRRRVENLIYVAPDEHDGPMPMDFFVWAVVGGDGVVLVDTGSDEPTCSARGHDFLQCPTDGLARIGIVPRDVHTVVTTHLHWDHSGNLAAFPDVRLHVQRSEVAHACGPAMGRAFLRRPYDFDQLVEYLRALYGGRVTFHDGDEELAPGLSIHHVGGHTPGMQVVRVNTRRGHVLLASDSVHFYENLHNENPFPVLVSTIDYVDALGRVSALADSADHIVPGHDPAVLATYPAVSPDLAGTAVRLDAAPVVPPASEHT
jgi:glyoxylase-like metal-dependent hydrolase (beta-lactamase superfamily II)